MLTQYVDSCFVQYVKEHEQVHCEQAEGGQCYLIFRLIIEWLNDAMSALHNASLAAWSYLAFEEISDLLLYALRLSKEAFVDAQPLKPSLPVTHIVYLCCAVFDGASEQVL
jgi:hypothetical protein